MVAAEEEVVLPGLNDAYLVGELALTGAIRPVRGALAVAWEARRRGKKRVFVPMVNAHEAAVVEGIDVYGVHSLRDVFEFLRGGEHAPSLEPVRQDTQYVFFNRIRSTRSILPRSRASTTPNARWRSWRRARTTS